MRVHISVVRWSYFGTMHRLTSIIAFLILPKNNLTALEIRENIEDCANIELLKFLKPRKERNGNCETQNILTGIVSKPGSGVTWVRHLIQMSTGIHSGSVYKMKPKPKNFPFEGVKNSSVIGIKDHFMKKVTKKYDRVILVVRDPLEQAFSPSNALIDTIDYLESKFPIEKILDIPVYLEETVDSWKTWHLKIMKLYQEICVIFYHKLKEDVIKELEPCINFLGFELPPALKKCILDNQTGNYKRPERSFEEWQEIINNIPKELQLRINAIKDKVFRDLEAKNRKKCH